MAINFFSPQPRRIGLLPVETVTLLYTLFTTALILLMWNRMVMPFSLLEGRGFILLGMCATWLVYRAAPCRATLFLRTVYPLTLLAYYYPDTYEFCRLFPNLDYIFAAAEEALFGCQPSLEFSRLLPQKLCSELLHMGYLSYYPLILLAVIAPLLYSEARQEFERGAFVVMTCFIAYYTIYLFLPVTGPQYYFQAVGVEVIESGIYPELDDYFNYHNELMITPTPPGFFSDVVDATQASGERPTAAFPSSHVGMATVIMLLLRRVKRALVWAASPLYVLLCCSTVYIAAHYLIDAIAGFVTAFPLFYTASWLYGTRCFAGRNDPLTSFARAEDLPEEEQTGKSVNVR